MHSFIIKYVSCEFWRGIQPHVPSPHLPHLSETWQVHMEDLSFYPQPCPDALLSHSVLGKPRHTFLRKLPLTFHVRLKTQFLPWSPGLHVSRSLTFLMSHPTLSPLHSATSRPAYLLFSNTPRNHCAWNTFLFPEQLNRPGMKEILKFMQMASLRWGTPLAALYKKATPLTNSYHTHISCPSATPSLCIALVILWNVVSAFLSIKVILVHYGSYLVNICPTRNNG